tara:strand:+ start:32 stop:433 length:402 start_codon:yes stop_codon:yes gene_type:complete
MPVKSTASTPAKSTTPRKRRTRKTSTKPVLKKTTVESKAFDLTETELKTVEKMIVASTPKKKATPKAKVTRAKKLKRPAKTVLTLNHYKRDFESRMKIHNYEVDALIRDFLKGWEQIKPYHAQMVKQIKTITF